MAKTDYTREGFSALFEDGHKVIKKTNSGPDANLNKRKRFSPYKVATPKWIGQNVSDAGGFREASYEDKDRHTALYHALFDFIIKSRKMAEEAEDTGGFHKCPYCEQRLGQINDYFTHIEFFHLNHQ